MKANKGQLFIICGPSGCGKGTVIKELLTREPDIFLSVSATTRQPREGEVDGVHYHFLKTEQFESLIGEEGFLEHACFCGNYYGTPRKPVDDHMENGHPVVLEIEVDGAEQVRKLRPDAVTIYILPPSLSELRARLVGRGTEAPEVVEKRLARAVEEIPFAYTCDYVVTNHVVEETADALRSIIRSQSFLNKHMTSTVDALLSEKQAVCE